MDYAYTGFGGAVMRLLAIPTGMLTILVLLSLTQVMNLQTKIAECAAVVDLEGMRSSVVPKVEQPLPTALLLLQPHVRLES